MNNDQLSEIYDESKKSLERETSYFYFKVKIAKACLEKVPSENLEQVTKQRLVRGLEQLIVNWQREEGIAEYNRQALDKLRFDGSKHDRKTIKSLKSSIAFIKGQALRAKLGLFVGEHENIYTLLGLREDRLIKILYSQAKDSKGYKIAKYLQAEATIFERELNKILPPINSEQWLPFGNSRTNRYGRLSPNEQEQINDYINRCMDLLVDTQQKLDTIIEKNNGIPTATIFMPTDGVKR